MKILLVSDKEEPYIWDHFDPERFRDVEMIISCGDLEDEYLSFLVTMIKAPLFYVPGNHNESYLKKPPEGCISIDNKLVVYKNIRLLGLGGSMLYNNGPFQYTEKQMKRKILRLKPSIWRHKGFDILATHAPACEMGDGKDVCHQGFQAFIGLLDEYSPRYFLYGHQHIYSNIEPRIRNYKNTTMINAYGYYLLDY